MGTGRNRQIELSTQEPNADSPFLVVKTHLTITTSIFTKKNKNNKNNNHRQRNNNPKSNAPIRQDTYVHTYAGNLSSRSLVMGFIRLHYRVPVGTSSTPIEEILVFDAWRGKTVRWCRAWDLPIFFHTCLHSCLEDGPSIIARSYRRI